MNLSVQAHGTTTPAVSQYLISSRRPSAETSFVVESRGSFPTFMAHSNIHRKTGPFPFSMEATSSQETKFDGWRGFCYKSNPQARLEGLRTIWDCSRLRSLVVHTREEGLRRTGMDLNNLKNPCAFHAQKDLCLRENHPKSGRWKSVRANLWDCSGWAGSGVGVRVGRGAKLLLGKYH